MMGLYRERVVPWLTNCAMRNRDLVPYRQRIASAATGRVLEVGMGSGMNLPFYGAGVTRVLGLDPSARLLAMARRAAPEAHAPLELIEGTAEAIPLDNATVDTVLTTWTLCSIPDAGGALQEMRRVLRPTGRLLFVEHGRAPEARMRWWQDSLTPVWKTLAGGCHLNRPVADMIENAGFVLDRLETGYMRGLKPMTFMYEGSARR